MKKLLLLICLNCFIWHMLASHNPTIFISNAEAVTQWCDDVTARACYNIETGSGTTITDLSGEGNTGNFKGAGEPAWSVDVPGAGDGFNGTSTQSVYGDGSNDYINLGSDTSIDDMSALTFVVWANWDDSPDFAERLFDKVEKLFYTTSAENATIVIRTDSTDLSRKISTHDIGQWVHVAVTWDGGLAQTGVDIYIDGSAVDNGGITGLGNLSGDAANDMYLMNVAAGNRAIDGKFDEVAFFEAVKDSTDINDIMDNGLVQAAAGGGAAETFLQNATLQNATIQ